jgi:hypothetical protein
MLKHRIALAALTVVVALGHAPVVHAEAMTGNMLLQICTNKYSSYDSYCRGYILGITEVLTDSRIVQIPAGTSDNQLKDIVVKWLQANPKVRHHSGLELVATALGQAYQ